MSICRLLSARSQRHTATAAWPQLANSSERQGNEQGEPCLPNRHASCKTNSRASTSALHAAIHRHAPPAAPTHLEQRQAADVDLLCIVVLRLVALHACAARPTRPAAHALHHLPEIHRAVCALVL